MNIEETAARLDALERPPSEKSSTLDMEGPEKPFCRKFGAAVELWYRWFMPTWACAFKWAIFKPAVQFWSSVGRSSEC